MDSGGFSEILEGSWRIFIDFKWILGDFFRFPLDSGGFMEISARFQRIFIDLGWMF